MISHFEATAQHLESQGHMEAAKILLDMAGDIRRLEDERDNAEANARMWQRCAEARLEELVRK